MASKDQLEAIEQDSLAYIRKQKHTGRENVNRNLSDRLFRVLNEQQVTHERIRDEVNTAIEEVGEQDPPIRVEKYKNPKALVNQLKHKNKKKVPVKKQTVITMAINRLILTEFGVKAEFESWEVFSPDDEQSILLRWL